MSLVEKYDHNSIIVYKPVKKSKTFEKTQYNKKYFINKEVKRNFTWTVLEKHYFHAHYNF